MSVKAEERGTWNDISELNRSRSSPATWCCLAERNGDESNGKRSAYCSLTLSIGSPAPPCLKSELWTHLPGLSRTRSMQHFSWLVSEWVTVWGIWYSGNWYSPGSSTVTTHCSMNLLELARFLFIPQKTENHRTKHVPILLQFVDKDQRLTARNTILLSVCRFPLHKS